MGRVELRCRAGYPPRVMDEGEPSVGPLPTRVGRAGREADAGVTSRRGPLPGPGHARRMVREAVEQLAWQAASDAAAKLAWLAASSGRAALAAWGTGISAGIGGASMGLTAIGALQWGFERIIDAHRQAHEDGVRLHLAEGLAVTVALGLQQPGRPLPEVRQAAVERARQGYDRARVLDRLRRGGEDWPSDRRKRRELFDGWREGMRAGLRLLASLGEGRRRALGRATGGRAAEPMLRALATAAVERRASSAAGR